MTFANIAGYIGAEVSDPSGLLTSMLERMPNPRATAIETAIGERACLAARSLLHAGYASGPAIAQLSFGANSMAIALDGYVDNLADLVRREGIPSDPAQAVEILRLFAQLGTRLLPLLRGDFALAIADEHSREVLLARDAMGVRPLYFARHALFRGLFCFASLPQAVLTGAALPTRILPVTVWRELMGLQTVAPETVFANVQQVPPGSYVRFRDGNAELTEYASLRVRWAARSDEREILSEYSQCLAQEVSARAARTEGRLGVLLSGGLDSSAIVGHLHGKHQARILAATVLTTGQSAEDEAYAASVVAHCGVDWRRIAIDLEESWQERCLPWAPNPFTSHRYWIAEPPLSVFRDEGCSAYFTGAAGDISGGHNWRWSEYLRERGLFATWNELARCDGVSRRVRLRRLLRAEWDRVARYLSRIGMAQYVAPGRHQAALKVSELFCSPKLLRQQLAAEWTKLVIEEGDPYRSHTEDAHWFLLRGVGNELSNFDTLGRTFGIEPFHPLAAWELYEMAASLPWALRRRGAHTRIALREACSVCLPEAVVWRRGKVVLNEYVRTKWSLTVCGIQIHELEPLAGLIDLDAWRDHGRHFDALPQSAARVMYLLTVLQRWASLNGQVAFRN